MRRYAIDVVPMPLANYHHRQTDDDSEYGNSVHAASLSHRQYRSALITRAARGEEGDARLSDLYLLGDLEHSLQTSSKREFQRIQDYIWSVEQTLRSDLAKLSGGIVGGSAVPGRVKGRNLIANGDFRLWEHGDESLLLRRTTEIGPELTVAVDGRRKVTVQRRYWSQSGDQLAYGTPFLELSADAAPARSKYLTLEFSIPSALVLAGEAVMLSAMIRDELARGSQTMMIGGRHDFGNGNTIDLPAADTAIDWAWSRIEIQFCYPKVDPSVVRLGHGHRIIFQMPDDRAFRFQITQVQLEAGHTATEFDYR